MVKVKVSSYFRQIITVVFMAVLFTVAIGFLLKTWWAVIVIPVFLAFYHRDINRAFYLIGDKSKDRFATGTFVFCGDMDKLKRSADRSKDLRDGRLTSTKMTLNTYMFKEYKNENASPIKMSLYISDSINYRLILSRILKNNEHKFTITYGVKSGVITEIRA